MVCPYCFAVIQGFEVTHPIVHDVADGEACIKLVHYTSPETNAVHPQPTVTPEGTAAVETTKIHKITTKYMQIQKY